MKSIGEKSHPGPNPLCDPSRWTTGSYKDPIPELPLRRGPPHVRPRAQPGHCALCREPQSRTQSSPAGCAIRAPGSVSLLGSCS